MLSLNTCSRKRTGDIAENGPSNQESYVIFILHFQNNVVNQFFQINLVPMDSFVILSLLNGVMKGQCKIVNVKRLFEVSLYFKKVGAIKVHYAFISVANCKNFEDFFAYFGTSYLHFAPDTGIDPKGGLRSGIK